MAHVQQTPALFGPGGQLTPEELAALASRDFGQTGREIEAGFGQELPPSLQALEAQNEFGAGQPGGDTLIRRDSPLDLATAQSQFATAAQGIGQNQVDIARANQLQEAQLAEAQGAAATAQPGFQLEQAAVPRRTESVSDVTQDITQDLTNIQGITPELAESQAQRAAIGGLENIGRGIAGIQGAEGAAGITETLSGLADPQGAEEVQIQRAVQEITAIALQQLEGINDPGMRRVILEKIAQDIGVNMELARSDGSLDLVLQQVEQQLAPSLGLAGATP